VCALFALVVTLAVLQFSFRHGRLILYAGFDDVGYFEDGMRRLQVFYDKGFGAVITHYRTIPPHSPFSSAMAFVAFALFGFHDWAPYALNSLLAFGYFLLADRLLRGAAFWQKIVCFVFVATLPFVGMAVHEFRPDHAVALFTATGVFLLLTAPFVHGSRRRQLAAGAMFGLAMLTKPPVFPQTLVIGAATLLLATFSDWGITQKRPRASCVARAWCWVLLPFIVIPLPHYWLDFGGICAYIKDILWGANRASYLYRGNRAAHLLYYLTGDGGRVMLGDDIYLFTALLPVLLLSVLALRRRADFMHAAALSMVLVLAWVIATANKTKSAFFGLTFDTLLAFMAVYFMGRIMVALRHRAARAPRGDAALKPWRQYLAQGWARAGSLALIIATISGMYQFQWPTRTGNYYTGWQQNRREIATGIFDVIVSHSTFGGADAAPAPDPKVLMEDKVGTQTPSVLFCEVGDMNTSLMNYMALKRQVDISFIINGHATSMQDMMDGIDNADFVIAAESGTMLVADFLALNNWQDQILDTLRARHDFRQIGKFTFRKFGRSIYVFEHIGFFGFKVVKGLGAIEPAIPALHQTAVRWGTGPRSTIRVNAKTAGDYDLWWNARTFWPGQVVTVKLDGIQVANPTVIASPVNFTQALIPLKLTAGLHQIDLVYTYWQPPGIDPRPMAVLFKELQVYKTKPESVEDGPLARRGR